MPLGSRLGARLPPWQRQRSERRSSFWQRSHASAWGRGSHAGAATRRCSPRVEAGPRKTRSTPRSRLPRPRAPGAPPVGRAAAPERGGRGARAPEAGVPPPTRSMRPTALPSRQRRASPGHRRPGAGPGGLPWTAPSETRRTPGPAVRSSRRSTPADSARCAPALRRLIPIARRRRNRSADDGRGRSREGSDAPGWKGGRPPANRDSPCPPGVLTVASLRRFLGFPGPAVGASAWVSPSRCR